MYDLDNIIRVNLATNGTVNAKYGDASFAEDGSNGRVMVQIPRLYAYAAKVDGVYQRYISDRELPGFYVHPAFVQRGHVGDPADYIYVGAYEADLVGDAAGNHKLHSRSGKQPMTGGVVFEVSFDGGQNEPNVDDNVDTAGGDTWVLRGYEVTSGSWGSNDAAGKLWITKAGDDAPGWSDNETITNTTQSNTLATVNGAPSSVHFDIDEAEDYANNIGGGWGITNIWTRELVKLLMMLGWGNLDSQSTVGRGVVDKAGGTGFNGELTASNGINSNLDSNGTIQSTYGGAAGQANDGTYPIAWRFIENFWGNVWEFVIGYNAVDAEYRIVNRAGLASVTYDGALAGGDYEATTVGPITSDGYISDIVWEPLTELMFLPSETSGGASSHIPDYFWAHDVGETNILLARGGWAFGAKAGAGCLSSNRSVGLSARLLGGRVEFIPQ